MRTMQVRADNLIEDDHFRCMGKLFRVRKTKPYDTAGAVIEVTAYGVKNERVITLLLPQDLKLKIYNQ